ncbi:tripartite tricarboxylate transporter TctB family protein [Rhodovulum sulfidophilum]|uniref:tripartite tricarboxylate transporter TctB family protein n=1 Tax=Rhodovulum sulfidophilum TaxID=35806 RepID=UPI00192830D5|nr:tripartite tricarboxylate transporter TctB family protein [Rhodovulum sulfidophilum]MBL3587367.1 tripartite tricarboxylate transporter TctB family protein [Rhodovulum sulfidophilum]
MTGPRNGQILFALGLALANTVYGWQVLQMSRPFAAGEPGPAFLPALLCLALYGLLARVLISEFRTRRAEASGEAADTGLLPVLGPLFAIGATALFVIGFVWLGYVISAALYSFAIAFYFNVEDSGRWGRSALVALPVAAGVTGFGWLFFDRLFGLTLPVWGF